MTNTCQGQSDSDIGEGMILADAESRGQYARSEYKTLEENVWNGLRCQRVIRLLLERFREYSRRLFDLQGWIGSYCKVEMDRGITEGTWEF